MPYHDRGDPNFYPRSPRGERLIAGFNPIVKYIYFYPRSPRGERLRMQRYRPTIERFLPALPARGATRQRNPTVLLEEFLPALPARGATMCNIKHLFDESFLPALPARGATLLPRSLLWLAFISTRAPREGSDSCDQIDRFHIRYFYPRSPRGERPCGYRCTRRTRWHFYPRSPRGERRVQGQGRQDHQDFYPRSPRGERRFTMAHLSSRPAFLPALPARGATSRLANRITSLTLDFYPRSPRGERLMFLPKS